MPAGFLVEARLKNRRNYHVRVPLNILGKNDRLRLVLSDDPKKPNELSWDKLRLRTLPGRQLYYLYVDNRSTTARDVRVEILKGDASSLEPLETSPKLTAKDRTPTKVPSFGPPVTKPDQALLELEGPLTFRIVDDKTQVILDEHRLPVEMASATDLVGAINARFVPQSPGEKNKLSVVLEPGPGLLENSPPCPVELVLSKRFFPRREGPPRGAALLSGNLEANAPLTLFATDIPLDLSQPEKGYFQLDIDGRKRALWFQANFPARGNAAAGGGSDPRIRFDAEARVESGKPTRLERRFEVDYPPPDGQIRFRMVRNVSNAGPASSGPGPWQPRGATSASTPGERTGPSSSRRACRMHRSSKTCRTSGATSRSKPPCST